MVREGRGGEGRGGEERGGEGREGKEWRGGEGGEGRRGEGDGEGGEGRGMVREGRGGGITSVMVAGFGVVVRGEGVSDVSATYSAGHGGHVAVCLAV